MPLYKLTDSHCIMCVRTYVRNHSSSTFSSTLLKEVEESLDITIWYILFYY